MSKISRRELLRRGAMTSAGLAVGAALPSRALASEGRTSSDGPLQLARVWPGRDGLLNPSTRPHVQRDGGEESYELTVLGAGGGTARKVTAVRGEVVDLGNLKVV